MSLLVLNQNGSIEIDAHNPLILHQNSRIGWFGCWLILMPQTKGLSSLPSAKRTTRLYLWKDSFSAVDYSRLCRHILKNKTAAQQVIPEELR